MKYSLFFILFMNYIAAIGQTEITVTADDGIGVNITNPTRYFHVELPEFENINGIYSRVNYTGNSDVRAIESYSNPNPGFGIGGHFTGGFRGVYALGEGGSSNNVTFPTYGIYARSQGSAGTRIGVFGEALGGDKNLAAKFGDGDIEIDNLIRVNSTNSTGRLTISNSDNIGSYAAALRMYASNNGPETTYGAFVNSSNSGTGISVGYRAITTGPNDLAFWGQGNSYFTGDVRIGQNVDPYSGSYKLVVDGKILTEEVRVQNSLDWPDYVFDEKYELRSLKAVEEFISENHHLPNIPSAKEIDNNGIVVGEMQTLMMEKIEELTLYLIQQQKRITLLETELKSLKNEK